MRALKAILLLGNPIMTSSFNSPQDSHILIVDDDAISRTILRTILKHEGYQVHAVSGGYEALKKAESECPDLVLLDIMMPEMDGFETFKGLQSCPKTADIPVIFVSAKAEDDEIVDGFRLGVVDYISKPYIPEILLARVKVHVALRQVTRFLQKGKEALKQKNDLANLLHHAAASANMTDDVDQAIYGFLQSICHYKNWPVGHAYFCSESSPTTLTTSKIWYMDNPKRYKALKKFIGTAKFKGGAGGDEAVVTGGKTVLRTDVAAASSHLLAGQSRELSFESYCAIPVKIGSRVEAVLEFYSHDVEVMDHFELLALEDLGIQLGRVFERKRAEKEIRYLAGHDALTGLPNQRLFIDRVTTSLSLAKRNKGKVALLFIDLDGFKSINDTHGHDAGDEVLRLVAARYAKSVRKADTVARIGGDEFVILLTDINKDAAAEVAAEKILSAMSSPFVWQAHELRLGASIGISMYPDNGSNIEELRQQADRAMYQVKQQGKNNYRFASALSGSV